MSAANGTLGTARRADLTLKGSNNMLKLLAFSERKMSRPVLGFRSFHSLHPRLYKFIAVGDKKGFLTLQLPDGRQLCIDLVGRRALHPRILPGPGAAF